MEERQEKEKDTPVSDLLCGKQSVRLRFVFTDSGL